MPGADRLDVCLSALSISGLVMGCNSLVLGLSGRWSGTGVMSRTGGGKKEVKKRSNLSAVSVARDPSGLVNEVAAQRQFDVLSSNKLRLPSPGTVLVNKSTDGGRPITITLRLTSRSSPLEWWQAEPCSPRLR